MPIHLVEPSNDSIADPGSGNWVKPDSDRPTFVTFRITATGVGSGDTVDIDIEVRDPDGTLLSGYPARYQYARGGLTTGSMTLDEPIKILAPPDHDVRYVDNSTGASLIVSSSTEDAL